MSGAGEGNILPPGRKKALMRGKPFLFAGILLAGGFVAYRVLTGGFTGPPDKAVQLVLLVPAAAALGAWLAGRIRGDMAESILGKLVAPPSWLFIGTAMALLGIFSVWMAFGPLEGIPKGGDETAYYFQSKIYAAGKLAAPAPAVENPGAYFPFRHFIFDKGRWFIIYTPFHSMLMAPLTAAGPAPLLGPLEGMLTLLGVYLLVRLWGGETLSRVTVVLFLLSPFFLFMTPTLMAHNSNLMLVTWSLYFISRAVKGAGMITAAAGGLLMGLAFATKPYPVLVWLACVPFAVFMLAGKRWRRVLLPAAVAAAVPFVLLLLSNYYYTGNPLKSGYDMVRGGRLLGFGSDKAWFPEYGDHAHTPMRGIYNVARQLGVGSMILFGWPFLSLLPVLFALFSCKRLRVCRLFVPLGLIMILMWLHYCPAIDYGPRHYFTFLPVIMVLSALGLREALHLAERKKGRLGKNMVTAFVLFLFGITLLVYMPEGIALRSGPWQAVDSIPGKMAREVVTPPAVVFMQAGQYGYPNICSGLNFDSPFLDGDVIFCAHQTPAEDRLFMEAYPGRKPYLFWLDGERFRMEEWTRELAEEVAPTRRMKYRTYLHRPDFGQEEADLDKSILIAREIFLY